MPSYEYKVVPAPEKARRVRGLKGPALFANAIEELINEMAAEGWCYLRAETLPQEERKGLTSSVTMHRNLLIFQREIMVAPAVARADPAAVPAPSSPADPPQTAPQAPDDPAPQSPLARRLFPDR